MLDQEPKVFNDMIPLCQQAIKKIEEVYEKLLNQSEVLDNTKSSIGDADAPKNINLRDKDLTVFNQKLKQLE